MPTLTEKAETALGILRGVIGSGSTDVPIKITGMAAQSVSEGGYVSLVYGAADYLSATGQAIVYSFLWDGAALPAWLVHDPVARTVLGQAPVGSAGAHTLTRRATSTVGGTAYVASDSAAVAIAAGNAAPIWSSAFADQVFATGAGGSIDIPVGQLSSDPDGDPLTWSARGLAGAALPAGLSYSVPAAGVLRLAFPLQASPGGSYQVEIVASDGVLETVSVLGVGFDDAPSGQFDFTVSADGEVYLPLVQRSDDPINNLIVPGSVIAENGSIREALDQLGVFYTRAAGTTVNDQIQFKLIDQNLLETDLVANITNVTTADIIGSPISVSAALGAAGTIDLNAYFTGGVGGIDPAGFTFVDAGGATLGTTFTLDGVWAPAISALGILTPNFDPAFLGSVPTVYILPRDRAGNVDDATTPLNYRITSAVGSAPFPAVGVPGSGPLVVFNFDFLNTWKGARQLANVGKELFFLTKLGNAAKGGLERANEGSINQQTGLATYEPNFTKIVGQIRQAARPTSFGRPDLDTGKWVIISDVTGDALIECKGYPFTQVSANRWERVYTAADTGPSEIQIVTGPLGGTIDFSTVQVCLETEIGQLWKAEHRNIISRGHCLRVLDFGHGVNGGKVVRAADVARHNDAIWSVMNGNGARRGIPMSAYLELCMDADIGVWWPCPWALGGESIEAEIYAAVDSTTSNALVAAAKANAAQILADMQVEDVAYANYVCDEMDAVGWPENMYARFSSGNEVFNFAGGFWYHARYCLGLGEGLQTVFGSSAPANNFNQYAYGAHTASLAKAFTEVFAVRRPNQHWAMSVDVHTAGGTGKTTRIMQGLTDFNRYAASPVPMTRFRGAKTNYSSGALKYRGAGALNAFGSPDMTTFYDTLVAQYNADRDVCFAALRDWMVGAVAMRDNNAKVVEYHNTQKAIFESYGTIMDADYEGTSGDDINVQEVARLPQLGLIAEDYLRSDYCAQAQLDLNNRILAVSPDFMIADYGIFGASYQAPWNTLLAGEDLSHPFYQIAFEPFLRPASGGGTPPVSPPPDGSFCRVALTVNYAGGAQSGLPILVTNNSFTGGALHNFFQKAQTNAGCIRAYSDLALTNELPIKKIMWDKALGKMAYWVQPSANMPQGSIFYMVSGGPGNLVARASTDPTGSRAVFPAASGWLLAADFDQDGNGDYYNAVDDVLFANTGAAVASGPNSLPAVGFGSQGSKGTTDVLEISLANPAVMTEAMSTYRVSNGVSDAIGYGRYAIGENQGDDFHNEGSTGFDRLEIEHATTDGKYRVARAPSGTWTDFGYVKDGSLNVPNCYRDGAAATVIVTSAPVGAMVDLPADNNGTGNHPPKYDRGMDGRIAFRWRLSVEKDAAFFASRHQMIYSPATFLTADTGTLF